MSAALDDAPLLHDHDTVGVLDRGQAVGDDERGPSLHQSVHARLYQFLGAGIDGGGRLIQDQCRRVRNSGTGNRQKLPLSLAQVRTVAGKHRVITVRQPADESICVGKLRRLDALLIRGVQLAVTDVLHDGSGVLPSAIS